MKELMFDRKITAEIVENNGQPAIIDPKELLLQVLKSPLNPSRGTNYEEMDDMVGLIRKIKPAEKSVLLEKSEHQTLVKALKGFPFAANEPAIRDWIKGIVNLPEIEVKPVQVPDLEAGQPIN